MLNAFTFSYNDIDREQISVTPGNKTWNDFGAKFTRTFTAEAAAGIHTQVDGYFNAFSRFPLNHFRKNIQFSEMLSWNRGAHFLKIGGDARRSVLDLQEFFRGDPWMRYRNTFTGDALADLLLGMPTQWEQIAEASNKPRVTEIDLFVQDDWKVSKRLTLNLGMRWDPWFPFKDELNKYAQIRPGQQSTVFPTAPAGVVFPGDPGTTQTLLKTRWANLAPRFGFAFDPTGSGKNSIRGGYGVFYSQVRQQANNQISTNQPFSLKLTVNNTRNTVSNPYEGVGNPFPFQPPTTDAEKQAYKWVFPLQLTQYNPDFRNAVMQQWNFSVQRQILPEWLLTLAYVGSKGNHLFVAYEMNPAIFGAPGATLDARRPLGPTFGNVSDQSSRANSLYHSMQITLNKRFSKGVTLLANYTWGKLIDDASGDGDGPANPFNFRNERGPSDFDITHRFVTSFVWELPALRGQHMLVRHTIGGWQMNGILTLQSGDWMTVTSGVDNSRSGVNGDRADVVGDRQLAGGRSRADQINRYFNTAAFRENAVGTFGNSGRNNLRGPGDTNIDFALIKNFPIREGWRLQLRGEAFNALNQVNLGNPNTNATSPQFGQITSAGAPRVLQIALKFIF